MKKSLIWTFSVFSLLVLAIVSLYLGVTDATLVDVWKSVQPDPSGQAAIIAQYRLPRLIAAILVGVHFGVAGAILQIVLRNPLADPTIFGVSGGASIAVVGAMTLVISLAPSTMTISIASDYIPLVWIPPIALLGGLGATLFVMLLSWNRQTGSISTLRMVLMGVVTGAVFNAIVMAMVVSLSESNTELAVLWLAGSLYARNFSHLLPALPWSLISGCIVLFLLPSLSALRLDRLTAASSGVWVKRDMVLLICAASILSASAVSVAGPVGFVGLLSPHIASRMGGNHIGERLLISALVGVFLVVMGDLVGRLIIAPGEMPVGILTSLIGAPFFAFLLLRRQRRGNGTLSS